MDGLRAVPQRRRLPFVQNFALLLSIFNPNPEIALVVGMDYGVWVAMQLDGFREWGNNFSLEILAIEKVLYF